MPLGQAVLMYRKYPCNFLFVCLFQRSLTVCHRTLKPARVLYKRYPHGAIQDKVIIKAEAVCRGPVDEEANEKPSLHILRFMGDTLPSITKMKTICYFKQRSKCKESNSLFTKNNNMVTDYANKSNLIKTKLSTAVLRIISYTNNSFILKQPSL